MDLKKMGQECKKWRECNNIRQKDIANDCNLSRESISGFENGRSKNIEILNAYINRGFEYGKAK